MKDKFKVLFIYPNIPGSTLLPLSISVLSAVLKEEGFDVELFDTTFYDTELDNFEKKKEWLLQVKPFSGIEYKESNVYDDLKKMVDNYEPDLIALNLGSEDVIDLGLSLLESVKEYNKSVPRMAGGVGVNFNYEFIFDSGLINICCIGEGEGALVEFCRHWEKGGIDPSTFLNLHFRLSDGIILKNYVRRPIELDSLPFPDFSIFEKERLDRVMHGKSYRMIHVEIDRGCPNFCTYCEAPAIRKLYDFYGKTSYYRKKSNDRIISELKHLKKKYKPDYINFSSETFLARTFRDLDSLMLDYLGQVDIPFWCQTRLETVTRDKIECLEAAGCVDMQFGIEHGDEKFRNKWLKRVGSNEQMLEAISVVENVGIPYTVNNIIGWPDETRKLVWDTINFNRLISPKTMNCYMMTPYKGTWMWRYCVDEGLLDSDAKTNQLLGGADIKYRYMTKQEFLGLQRCFSLYARMDESFYSEIRKAERFDDEGNKVFEELRKEFIKQFYS